MNLCGLSFALGVLLVLTGINPARAASDKIECSIGADPMLNFATITADPTTATVISAQLPLSCTSDKPVKACVRLDPGTGDSGGTRRMITGPGGGGYVLDFAVGNPNASGQPWDSVSRETTLPVWFEGRIGAGQEARAGDYESTMAGRVSVSDKLGQTCAQIVNHPNSVEYDFNLIARVKVQGLCTVDAQDLDFGVATGLSVDRTASTTINLDCTALVDYRVSLDRGLHNPAGPVGARAMRHVSGSEQISYELRDAPQGALLGDGTGGTIAFLGSGTSASLAVHGRVPAQATPSAGNYSDTVTVTVEY